jgi:hypothetical protein
VDESAKAAALRLAHAAFEGLAPLLIEHGVTSPEAEALLRAVCVHQAARAQAAKGKRPNVSRVSVETGVDRHAVAAILRRTREETAEVSSRRDSMSRVIDGWLSDPEYAEKGRPRDLEFGGPSAKGASLWALIQRYAPGVWPRLIADELIRVDFVEVLASGKVRWKDASRPNQRSARVRPERVTQQIRHAIREIFLHDALQRRSPPKAASRARAALKKPLQKELEDGKSRRGSRLRR